MVDIYFSESFPNLYSNIEDGEPVNFVFENSNGKVIHNFIKRQIENTDYYDITSPYGYGGPYIADTEEKANKSELIQDYLKSYQDYCEKNNIVSEFVRFHPLYDNVSDFENFYDTEAIRKIVITDLTVDDVFQDQFSKSCRKKIRKLLKNELIEYEIIEQPQHIEDFYKVYYSTMDRNQADDYYYFDKNYFENALSLYRENIVQTNILYDSKVIASGFYFVSDGNIHLHLSGTLSEYLELSPAYLLRYAIIMWGSENGYSYVNNGGGRSRDENDSLFRFKSRFGKKLNDFYIGKKIYKPEVYNELSKNKTGEFFPAYRQK